MMKLVLLWLGEFAYVYRRMGGLFNGQSTLFQSSAYALVRLGLLAHLIRCIVIDVLAWIYLMAGFWCQVYAHGLVYDLSLSLSLSNLARIRAWVGETNEINGSSPIQLIY